MYFENTFHFTVGVEIIELNVKGENKIRRHTTRQSNTKPERIDNNIAFVFAQGPKGHQEIVLEHDDGVGLKIRRQPDSLCCIRLSKFFITLNINCKQGKSGESTTSLTSLWRNTLAPSSYQT